MLYGISADIIVTVHLLWILFLILGALVGMKVRWVRLTHIGALAFSVLLQLNNWVCPITHLEYWLRSRSDSAYTGGFIKHYVEKLVYLDVSPSAVLWGTGVVIVGSIFLYWRGSKCKCQMQPKTEPQ